MTLRNLVIYSWLFKDTSSIEWPEEKVPLRKGRSKREECINMEIKWLPLLTRSGCDPVVLSCDESSSVRGGEFRYQFSV
jgi:hypothetical protein